MPPPPPSPPAAAAAAAAINQSSHLLPSSPPAHQPTHYLVFTTKSTYLLLSIETNHIIACNTDLVPLTDFLTPKLPTSRFLNQPATRQGERVSEYRSISDILHPASCAFLSILPFALVQSPSPQFSLDHELTANFV